MHPEFLREMTDQRGREMRALAHQARLARLVSRLSRRGRNLPDGSEGFVIPRIPDYVDGSFRTGPASTGAASTGPAGPGPAVEQAASEAGQAPAAHRAA